MLTFTSPQQAAAAIENLNKKVRLEIENKIKEILHTQHDVVIIKEDEYLGYPCVYDDNMHCSVMGLKRVSVNLKGRVQLTAGSHNHLRQPHCENLSTGELLQVWDIVLKTVKEK